MSRKNVLLLSKVIEHGLAEKDTISDDDMIGVVPNETLGELTTFLMNY